MIVALAGLGLGAAFYGFGLHRASDMAWAALTAAATAVMAFSVVHDIARRRVGVDVVALLALAGTLVVGQLLAGAVIALMLSTGRALEARAAARARHELSALIDRVPTRVHRVDHDSVSVVAVDDVAVGDVLLITAGEVVPVDGTVLDQPAVLDESALTGEALPVERRIGEPVRSGGVNAGSAFQLLTRATAEASTYAGVVRLVREAAASRAPLVRLADRYALWFVPLTLLAAGVAALLAHDLTRGVAVLVVATPCPLILAAPVALVGGMSRAARRGIIVKNGAALETLGRADIVLFDKTGTLTEGRAHVTAVQSAGAISAENLLRLAAAVDQSSSHALAEPIVAAAHERDLRLPIAGGIVEQPGEGIAGTIDGRRVAVGQATYAASGRALPAWALQLRDVASREGLATVFVGVDGEVSGALILEDSVRTDAPRVLQRLRDAGVRRIAMVTGDHAAVARAVGQSLQLDAVHADCSPAAKLDIVREERRRGTVAMVGDGINDAPALAIADVGVAMGIRGATASSQTAGVVLMVDRIGRLADALLIARRSRRIALQSIVAGMALSFIAMGCAAFGLLIPVLGAVVQEAIDVGVILNALRAHGLGGTRPLSRDVVAAGERVLSEHTRMRGALAQLRQLADDLGAVPPAQARARLQEMRRYIANELLPHEQVEDREVWPALVPYVGGEEAILAVRREHVQVAGLATALLDAIDALAPGGPGPSDLPELRRLLYSLHAVLLLHRSGEEERLMQVVDDGAQPPDRTESALSL